jgi:hypothetical protein
LLFARNVQHTVIVLDDVTHRLIVALDEGGDDLALKTAFLALLDDAPADNELQQDSPFAHVTASLARRPPRPPSPGRPVRAWLSPEDPWRS